MLALDTEFTNFQGDLISIALVSDCGDSVYCVRHFDLGKCHEWVRENVIPVLNQEPEDDIIIKRRIVAFLNRHREQPIIADWPADFGYLLDLLQEPNGIQWDVGDLEMRLVRDLDPLPAIPHNALSDARALLCAYYADDMIFGAPA
jgi:hypothetical protein